MNLIQNGLKQIWATLFFLPFIKWSNRRGRPYAYRKPGFSFTTLLPVSWIRSSNLFLENGDLRAFLALNSEICFAILGHLRSRKDRQARKIASGIALIEIGKPAEAAHWFYHGFFGQVDMICGRAQSYGFCDDTAKFFEKNKEHFSSIEGWQKLIAQLEDSAKKEEFQAAMLIVLFVLRKKKLTQLLFKKLDLNPTAQVKALEMRISIYQKDPIQFSENELEFFSGNDNINAVFENYFNRVFRFKEEPEKNEFTKAEQQIIFEKPYLSFLKGEAFRSLSRTMKHIVDLELEEAFENAQTIIEPKQALMDELLNKTGPLKVFIGGYGWSGSGAISDSLIGSPKVDEMPGCGIIPYINDGAESEPMIHQGPAGMTKMNASAKRSFESQIKSISHFFRMYGLQAPHRSYFQYKTVFSNRTLREKIGDDTYFTIVHMLVFDWLESNRSGDMQIYMDGISAFEHRIFNAYFPDENKVVIFNNSINTKNLSVLGHVYGNREYIAVDRDIRDQFSDQRTQNVFFAASVPKFVIKKTIALEKFANASKKLMKSDSDAEQERPAHFGDISVRTIQFQDWVSNGEIEMELHEKLFGGFNEVDARKFFEPTRSKHNIGIFSKNLSGLESTLLGIFQKLVRRS